MKSSPPIGVKSIFIIVLMLTFFIPIYLSAQEAKYPWEKQKNDRKVDYNVYIAVKPGIYSPQSSDLKDSDFDTGFNGEITIGCRLSPNFAVETAGGYFRTEAVERVSGEIYDLTYTGKVKANIDVIPITFTLKGILPLNKELELFALGGIGAHWVFGELKVSGTLDGLSGWVKLDDSDWIFGGHLGLGFHYNITPRVFVGAEGKYLWTSKAKLENQGLEAKFKIDGILATGVIGFRF